MSIMKYFKKATAMLLATAILCTSVDSSVLYAAEPTGTEAGNADNENNNPQQTDIEENQGESVVVPEAVPSATPSAQPDDAGDNANGEQNTQPDGSVNGTPEVNADIQNPVVSLEGSAEARAMAAGPGGDEIFELIINGEVANNKTVTLEYGQPIEMKLKTDETTSGLDVSLFINTTSQYSDYDGINNNKTLTDVPAGDYFVLYSYIYDNHNHESEVGASRLKVNAATIATPDSVTISEDKTVSFKKPTTTTNVENYPLASDAIAKYELKLYRKLKPDADYPDEAAATHELVAKADDPEIITTDFFRDKISEFGYYKITVTAISKDSEQKTYVNSSAGVSSDYRIYDETAPVISAFGVDSTEPDKLTATVKDLKSGLGKYAFSTADSIGAVKETEWHTPTDDEYVASRTDAGVTITYRPTESGTYHFYAMDCEGKTEPNQASSTNSIKVSFVNLHNYYSVDDKLQTGDDAVILVLDNQEKSLPAQKTGEGKGYRKGYTFEGWFQNQSGDEFADPYADGAIITATGSDIDVYAKWEGANINFTSLKIDSKDVLGEADKSITFTYGEGGSAESPKKVTLSAAAKITTGDSQIKYNWKKTGSDEYVWSENKETADLELKNVAESGEYKCCAIVTDSNGEQRVKESDAITVTINRATLAINYTGSKNISYGDPIPELTYSIENGLVNGDTADVVSGNLSTDYNPDNAEKSGVGSYPVSANGLSADNYTINMADTNIVVEGKVLSRDDIDAQLVIPEDGYTYTLDAEKKPVEHTPGAVVSIKSSEKVLEYGKDYTIEYSDNTAATSDSSKAKATIKFIGNYLGTEDITLDFDIAKAQRAVDTVVSIKNWTYKNSHDAATVTSSTMEGAPHITYYFSGTLADGTTSYNRSGSASYAEPVDAGTYHVYAVIAATDNYDSFTTQTVDFQILQRKLVYKSDSQNWVFDGNTHSLAKATLTEGSIASGDGVQSVVVTGEVLKPGDEVVNKIDITFDMATNPWNYNVVKDEGKLTVSQATLPSPSNCRWDSHDAGKATWTGITRNGVTQITYTLNLYKVGQEDEPLNSEPITTTDSYYDFSSIIASDRKEGLARYYYKVTAAATDGEYKDYYNPSNPEKPGLSEKAATVDVKVNFDTKSIAKVTIAGVEYHNDDIFHGFQGQSYAISVTPNRGYSVANPAWALTNESGTLAEEFSIVDTSMSSTTLKLGNEKALIDPKEGDVVVLSAIAVDDMPVISRFEGMNSDDYSVAYLDVEAYDSGAITGYKLWQGATEPEAWTSPSDGELSEENSKLTLHKPVSAAEIGTYHFKLKDGSGQDTHVVDAGNTVIIDKISFNSGLSDTQTMSDIVVVQDKPATLPSNTFVNTGYGFKNWKSGVGSDTYGDRDTVLITGSDTLTAVWTEQIMKYTVNYYEMDANGNYSEAPTTKLYEKPYGTIVDLLDATDVTLWNVAKGFEADTDRTKAENSSYAGESNEYKVTLNDSSANYTFNIYIKRKQFTLKYEYLNPSTGNYEIPSPVETYAKKYYYGQTIPPEAAAIPQVQGYTFSGEWTYKTTGSRPATMPAMDVEITVSCTAESASYVINYFVQDCPSGEGTNMFTPLPSSYSYVGSETILHDHGDHIEYDISEAAEKIGFTPAFTYVTYGEDEAARGSSTPTEEQRAQTKTEGDVSVKGIEDEDGNSKYLNINVYYSRNTYDINLLVGRKKLNETVKTYTWKDIPYGYVFKEYELKALETGMENISSEGKGDLIGSDGESLPYWEYLELIKNKADAGSDEEEKSRINTLVTNEKGLSETEAYVLGNFINWSTGSEPTSMPAGNMDLSRQYVLTSQSKFYVDVYLEKINTTDNTTYFSETADYQLPMVGDTNGYAQLSVNGTSIQGVNTVVDCSAFKEFVDDFVFYQYSQETNNEHSDNKGYLEKKQINDTNVAEGVEPEYTRLSLYLDRKVATTTITYFYMDGESKSNTKFATVTKEGKWGLSYNPEIFALFGDTDKTTDNTVITYVDGTDGNPLKDYDFYSKDYIATVSTSRIWRTSAGPEETATNYGWNSDYTRFMTEQEIADCKAGKNNYYFGKQNTIGAKDTTLKDNVVNVYYSKPVTSYELKLCYNTSNLTALQNPGISEYPVSQLTNNANLAFSMAISGGELDESFSAVKVANKCDVLENTTSSSSGDEYYPGAKKAYTTTYDYGTTPTIKTESGFNSFTLSQGVEYTFKIKVDGKYDADMQGQEYTCKITPTADTVCYEKNGCIYILDESNTLFLGRRASFSVGGTKETDYPVNRVVWQAAENIEQAYKALCENNEDFKNIDTSYDGVFECEEGYGSLLANASPDGTLYNCYHYHHEPTYRIYYVVGEAVSNDSNSSYAKGRTVYPGHKGGTQDGTSISEDFHPELHKNRELHWYTDTTYSSDKKMPESIEMPAHSVTYYGQWEKTALLGTFCEHYEMADPLEIDGQKVRYVTLSNIDAVRSAIKERDKITEDPFAKVTGKEEVEYYDEFLNKRTIECDVETYSYRGTPVLVVHKKPMIINTNVSVAYKSDADLQSQGTPGFYFDAAYQGNMYIGYCQDEAIDFDLYYARYKYSLSKDYQEHTNNNVRTYEELYGQTINLEARDRRGYTFDGWKVYELTEGQTEPTKDEQGKITQAPLYPNETIVAASDKSLSFAMPSKNLYAQAQWKVAPADYTIYHYLSNVHNGYEDKLVNELNKAIAEITNGGSSEYTSSDATWKNDLSGSAGTIKVICKSGTVIGAYRTVTTSGRTLYVYYIPDEVMDHSTTSFYGDAANAIGVTENVNLTSEEEKQINNYAVSFGELVNNNPFTFSTATYQLNEAQTSKTLSDSFKVDIDMTLSYYYNRLGNLSLELIPVSVDGNSETGLTLTGAGNYSFGEDVNLSENHVSTAYDFLGWYSEAVYNAAKNDEGIIDETELKEGEVSKAISQDPAFVHRVKSAEKLYAISKPKAIASGSIAVSSAKGSEYTYGTANTLKSVLTLTGAEEDNKFVHATNVKWYEKIDGSEDKLISPEDSAAANYSLPENTPVGIHTYYCVYTLTRSDNKRSTTLKSDDVTINITSKSSSAEATGYTGVYDGQKHNIDVKAAPGAQIYYNVGSPVEFDSTTRQPKEGTYKPGFDGIKDVDNIDNNYEQIVHYLVVDADPNVDPVYGSAVVKITPALLTMSLKAEGTFSKTYDGSDKITGDDKAKLQNMNLGTYYEIKGWVGDDGASMGDAYLLDFDGVTNTSHVEGSSSATLTNLHIVYKDAASDNNNYTFSLTGDSSIIIPATIEPRDIGLAWSTEPVIYSSEPQAPDYSISGSLPQIDGKTEFQKNMVQITGQQTKVGTGYTAYATIMTKEECVAAGIECPSDYQATDYVIHSDASNKPYGIEKCKLTVTPVSKTTIYDGYSRDYYISNGKPGNQNVFVFTGFTFKDNQTVDASTYYYGPSANDYVLKTNKNSVRIYETTGVGEEQVIQNITENFEIIEGTSILTILPREIIIENLGAKNKQYDATTDATAVVSDVTFADVYGTENDKSNYKDISNWDGKQGITDSRFKGITDDLGVDASKLSMAFESAAPGTNKEVDIKYNEETESKKTGTDILTGSLKSNFIVRYDLSQHKTTADITGRDLTLNLKDQVVTYGDAAPVLDKTRYTYMTVGGEPLDETKLPTLTYMIRVIKYADGTTHGYPNDDIGWVPYRNNREGDSFPTAVGVYEIKASLPEGFDSSVGNYILNTNTNAKAKLTVNPKEITVSGNNGVTKVYDGNTNATSLVTTDGIINSAQVSLSGVLDCDTALVQLKMSSSATDDSIAYDSKDCKDASEVTVKDYELNGTRCKNYKLADTSKTFTISGCSIKKRPVLVTADNASTTYGTAFDVSECTAIYGKTKDEGGNEIPESGFIDGESVSDIDVTDLAFTCAYTVESENRHAGNYYINVVADCLSEKNADANYSFKYATGTLTVNKAVITINASIDNEANATNVVYGSEFPTAYYTGHYSLAAGGLLLDDAIDTIKGNNWSEQTDGWKALVKYVYKNGEKTYTQVGVKYAPQGKYNIEPVVEALESDDYTFKPGTCSVINVTKPFIKVIGLTAQDKTYDGNTSAQVNWKNEGLKFEIYNEGSYSGESESLGEPDVIKDLSGIKALLGSEGITETDVLNVSKIAFNNKAANTSQGVDIQVLAGTLLKDRYNLIYVNGSNTLVGGGKTSGNDAGAEKIAATATAAINKKPLTVAVKSNVTTAKYGELNPATLTETFEYTGLIDGEAESLGVITGWDIDKSTIVTNANVGTYTIGFKTVDLSKKITDPERYSDTNKQIITTTFVNYLVTLQDTALTITQNQFANPTVTWDATKIGSVDWTKPANIGAASVNSYVLKLYKGEESVNITGATGYIEEKSGVLIESGDTLSYDGFTNIIRSNGAGKYYVTVDAISSNETNVKSSQGKTESALQATKVIIKPADAISIAGLLSVEETPADTLRFTYGQIRNGSTIAVTPDAESHGSSVILLAGETDVEYEFTINHKLESKYPDEPTGYTYVSTTAVESESIGTGDDLKAALVESSKKKYRGAVSLAAGETADEVTAIVKLNATPATLSVAITKTVNGQDANIKYGYAEGSVVFTATPSVVEDNIATGDYDYSYQWYFAKGKNKPDLVAGATGQTYTLPTGYASSSDDFYKVFCVVTATRNDNSQQKDNKSESNQYGTQYNFGIEKADVKGTASLEPWKYGEKRNVPVFTVSIGSDVTTYSFDDTGNIIRTNGDIDNLALNSSTGMSARIEFKRQEDSTYQVYNRVSNPIKDAGAYDVRLVIEGGDNFDDFKMPTPITVEVTKNKYDTPTDVKSAGATDKAAYGKVQWTLPKEIYENAEDDNKVPVAFHIDVYKIRLKSNPSEESITDEEFKMLKEHGLIINASSHYNDEYTKEKTLPGGMNLTETDIAADPNGGITKSGAAVTFVHDFSPNITEPGIYYFELFAFDNNSGAKPGDGVEKYDSINVIRSEKVDLAAEYWIAVSNNIDIKDGDNDVNTGVTDYTKIYDSKDVVLTVHKNHDETFKSYQWYKDGVLLDGETNESLSITYVAQSGYYSCRVTDIDDQQFETTTRKVTINPRPLVIKTEGQTFTYTGAQQGNSNWSIPEVTDTSASSTNLGLAKHSDRVDAITYHSLDKTVTTVADGEVSNVMTNIVIKRPLAGGTEEIVFSTYPDNPVSEAVGQNYIVTQDNGKLKIQTKDVSDLLEITFSGTDEGIFIYDGTEKKPEISVTYNVPGASSITLSQGVDYTVAYTNNVYVGKDGVNPTVTITGTGNYSGTLSREFTINKRPVALLSETLPADGVARYYDGTELKSDSSTIPIDYSESVADIGTEKGLANDDKVTAVNYTGKQLVAGTSNNTFDGIIIKDKDETKDLTWNYDIYHKYGTLTVEALPIIIKAGSASRKYNGQTLTIAEADPKYYVVTGDGYNNLIAGDVLVDGATVNGSITEVGTTASNIEQSTLVIKNAKGENVTAGYSITFEAGQLEVLKADTTVEITPKAENSSGVTKKSDGTLEISYNGTNVNLKDGAVSGSDSESNTNDEGTIAYTYYTSSDNGQTYNLTTTSDGSGAESEGGAPKNAGTYYVVASLTGATNFVDGKSPYTKLTIKKINRNLTVDDVTGVYNASAYTVSPVIDGDDAESVKSSINITYVGKNSEVVTNIDGKNVPVHAGTYAATVTVPETANYNSITKTATVTISKRAITVTSATNTKVYDGAALTDHSNLTVTKTEGVTYDGEAFATGDSINNGGVAFTGTITDVKYSDGVVTSVPNAYTNSSVKINNSNTSIGETTGDYEITFKTGTLTVTPKPITDTDVTLSATDFAYNGTAVGPTVTVTSTLAAGSTTLTEGADKDYVITEDGQKKVKTAAEVGSYTIEVIGKGNYTGTVTKTYTITNNTKADVKDDAGNTLTDDSKYCKELKLNVTSPNLYSVEITKPDGEGGTTPVDSKTSITNGQYTFTLNGVGDDVDVPTKYTITVKDVKSRDADGNITDYNTQTITVEVYPDHYFNDAAYELDDTKSPEGLVYKTPCTHDCGAVNYIIKPAGTVKWDYNYHYEVPGGESQSGVKNPGERETNAVVELMRNGTVIATKYVDCTAECKTPGDGSAAESHEVSYAFENYDPADPTKASGSARLDMNDESGNPYEYSIVVSPVAQNDEGKFVKIDTYSVTYNTEGSKLTGDKALIKYTPNTFLVPWKVTLLDMPDGFIPSEIEVKVLYAENEDTPDEGYKIITQHATTSVTCAGDGTYTGSYPCWEFIGGGVTGSATYYHRIQVVGYTLNGQHYDVTDKDYKSICDADHVNHTITYDPAAKMATGVILYEISGLLPQMIFNLNLGSLEAYKTIWKGLNGEEGPVTEEEIAEVPAPTRSGYIFKGWYDAKVGGNLVKGPVDLTNGSVTVYAHWEKKPSPSGGGSDDSPSPGGNSPIPVVTPIPPKTPVIPVFSPTGEPIIPKTPTGRPNGDIQDDDKPGDMPSQTAEPGTPDTEPEEPKGRDDYIGNIRVFLETNETPLGKLEASLADKQQVLDAVMNDEIADCINRGDSLEIRVTVDPKEEIKVPEGEKNLIRDRIEKLKYIVEGITLGRYIDIKLDWRVYGGEWNNIPRTEDNIQVTIEIPEDLRADGRVYYLSRANSDFEELMKDLDDDPNTITIATNDFEGTYAILYAEESEAECFWHWLILLCGLATLLILILVKIRRDEDEEETEADRAEDKADTPEEEEKKRKRNSRIRIVTFLLGTVLSVIFAILGTCRYDWPALIIQAIITGSVEVYKEVKVKQIEKGNEK